MFRIKSAWDIGAASLCKLVRLLSRGSAFWAHNVWFLLLAPCLWERWERTRRSAAPPLRRFAASRARVSIAPFVRNISVFNPVRTKPCVCRRSHVRSACESCQWNNACFALNACGTSDRNASLFSQMATTRYRRTPSDAFFSRRNIGLLIKFVYHKSLVFWKSHNFYQEHNQH